jgi:hypothetical protein
MRAFRKLLISDLKQFFRDRTALFFTFAFPILFIFIFGWVFSGAEDVSYNIGLVNNDDSPIGEGISQVLYDIPIFELSEGELDSQLEELEKGDLKAVIVIPTDIASSINSGELSEIKVYYDPTQTTSAQIIIPILRQAVDDINRQLTQQPLLLQLSEDSDPRPAGYRLLGAGYPGYVGTVSRAVWFTNPGRAQGKEDSKTLWSDATTPLNNGIQSGCLSDDTSSGTDTNHNRHRLFCLQRPDGGQLVYTAWTGITWYPDLHRSRLFCRFPCQNN